MSLKNKFMADPKTEEIKEESEEIEETLPQVNNDDGNDIAGDENGGY